VVGCELPRSLFAIVRIWDTYFVCRVRRDVKLGKGSKGSLHKVTVIVRTLFVIVIKENFSEMSYHVKHVPKFLNDCDAYFSTREQKSFKRA
jgi:predicted glycoside hydrolase/deacetylase ChbG (UPF0249 family)